MKSPLKRLSYVLSFIGETPATRSKPAREHSADHLLSYYESSIPNEGRNYARSPTTAKGPSSRPTHPSRKISTTSMSSDSDYSYDSEVTDAKDTASDAPSSTTRRPGTPSKGGADRRRVAIVQMDSVSERAYKTSSETASTTGSIRSRRGHKSNLAGLALVAPPDAALRTYTQLTPPSTAPITGDYMNQNLLTAHQDKGHNRSASENLPPKKAPSRDTATVGVAQGSQSSIPNLSAGSDSKKGTKDEDNNKNNLPHSSDPQKTTNSRSISPDQSTNKDERIDGTQGLLSPPYSGYPSMNAIDMFSPIVTPEIGEEKEIHVPVAAPIVVKLDNMKSKKAQSAVSWRSESPAAPSVHSTSSSYAASATSAYLRYEPGVHATAGPLPPPPRATFNIDASSPPPPRPPRLHSPSPARTRGDMEAVKQALQLPPSVTAVLASASNLPTTKDDESDCASVKGKQGSQLSKSTSVHRREGATLSSSVTDTSSIESASSIPRESSPDSSAQTSSEEPNTDKKPSPSETPVEGSLDVPAVTVIEALPRSDSKQSEKIDHTKFDQWLKENPQLAQPFEDARRGISVDEPRRASLERPLSPLSADHTGEAPSPPPKSFRNSMSNNLKRLSGLPRTPSLSSRSGRRSSGSTRYSRTPSPSLRHVPHPSFKKIISSNPAALFCHEVHSQNTTLQRCAIYAAKINELYIHDCGLSEWVVETKTRGQNPQTQRGPSSNSFAPQPRQTSRSSMISEATFPIRPDASTATDLSQGAYRDITPPGLPPSLPYPSLAINPPRSQPTRSNSSVGSGTPPSSLRSLAPATSTKGAGFFASLGRKASLSSRKERFPPGVSSSGPISPATARLPTKNSPATMNISRPINLTTSPTVPGGPRAPPRRPQRSQTFTTSFSPPSTNERDRDESLGRRPSLFNLTLDTVVDIQPDPAFTRQVDHLAALLPHANRDILAGYLRRAGQDMLAIGQYLEDERMGTIRNP